MYLAALGLSCGSQNLYSPDQGWNWAPALGAEIPGARVFREVIKFKRGHGLKPLKEERGIRELPLPSENAGRKDHDMKTQWEDSRVQGSCFPWSQPSNLWNCEKTRLLFKPPSLVLCHGSWSRLVNTFAIERSTHTNLEKVTAGSFSSENPELSWSSSSSEENWNIVSVSPHLRGLSRLLCGSNSGPQRPSSSGGCDHVGWVAGKGVPLQFSLFNFGLAFFTISFANYLSKSLHPALQPPPTMAPSCFTLSTNITHPQL